MASKDQTLGALIFLLCVVVIIGYIVALFGASSVAPLLGLNGEALQFWLVAVPVLIAFVAVLAIGAWIGWTMATTPPPKPLEEIETEETAEVVEEEKESPEEEAKPEEKKEA
jgi:hypothetical protein